MLEHFVEAYWLAAQGLRALRHGPLPEKEHLSRTLSLGDRLYAQGDLLLQESLNQEAVKNALHSFSARGVIETTEPEGRKGSMLHLLPAYDHDDKLDEFIQSVQHLLPSRK